MFKAEQVIIEPVIDFERVKKKFCEERGCCQEGGEKIFGDEIFSPTLRSLAIKSGLIALYLIAVRDLRYGSHKILGSYHSDHKMSSVWEVKSPGCRWSWEI